MSDVITKDSIIACLNQNIPVYVFKSLPSTNTFAKTLNEKTALIVADSQSAGRGRLGRSFHSPSKSGIYLSLKVNVPNLYNMVPFITTLSAAATCSAIENVCHAACGIKWVNDIYIGRKKTAGILCESQGDDSVIIGIGVNFYPCSFPDELKDIACSCGDFNKNATRSELIGDIVNNLIALISALPDTSFMEYYKSRSIVIGKSVLCIRGDDSFEADATGITDEGYLIVKTKEGVKTLSSGEVTIRFKD